MTSIITVLGTMGVAVGLALKDSLSNVAGGVILLVNRTLKVGDYVDIGAYSGTVDEVSILFTKITTVVNVNLIVGNNNIFFIKLFFYLFQQIKIYCPVILVFRPVHPYLIFITFFPLRMPVVNILVLVIKSLVYSVSYFLGNKGQRRLHGYFRRRPEHRKIRRF